MEDNFDILKDISYGTHERHRFDLFIPKSFKSDSGLILFIHGGGWSDGDKTGHHVDCRHFCNLGYVCAAMNYRFVTDEISIFNELDDITCALNTIKIKCFEHGLNITKAILSGGSAGGHLSLMYAYTRKNESDITPVAVCAYCPPVDCSKSDFLLGISGEFEDWKYGILSKCCGEKVTKSDFLDKNPQTALKRISPVEYITPDCVPTAVFHGRNDELVPFEHTVEFIGILEKNKVENTLLIYEKSGHSMKDDPETEIIAKKIINVYAENYL